MVTAAQVFSHDGALVKILLSNVDTVQTDGIVQWTCCGQRGLFSLWWDCWVDMRWTDGGTVQFMMGLFSGHAVDREDCSVYGGIVQWTCGGQMVGLFSLWREDYRLMCHMWTTLMRTIPFVLKHYTVWNFGSNTNWWLICWAQRMDQDSRCIDCSWN